MTGMRKPRPVDLKKPSELNARIGKRVRQRREQLGWTRTKLSVVAEMSQSYISKLEVGEVGFSPETLYKVAGALAISVDRLLASEGNVESALADFRRVPVLDYVQAGNWMAVRENMSESDYEETVAINFDCPPSTFALRIRGDSMLPRFQPGDILIVDPTRQPKPGDFVIARDETGEAIFKQYREVGLDSRGRHVFELTPLNPVYGPRRSDRQQLAIVGIVIQHRHDLVRL